MMRWLAALGLALLLAGCTDDRPGAGGQDDASNNGGDDGAAGIHDVEMVGFAFKPQALTIDAGDTVRWTNRDNSPHTATGDGFDTGGMGQGDVETVAFDEPGTYDYVCQFHSGMKGTITVA